MALTKLTTNINLEMSGDTRRYLVSAKQGDKATRFIVAKLFNNGEAYTIPSGARAIANIEKPDGKHVYNTCTYSGSEVTVELTNQALAAAGTAYCDIEIRTSDNTEVITSVSFTIEIEKSMRSDDAILSANEFTELENRIAAAVRAIEERIEGAKRYGMKINKNDSNPKTRCTYLFDAEGMTPASMNFTSGTFDFGSWGDVFFVKNNYPAMVKYDGTEDYKLDPNDHTKKADGTASDASNMSYGGNAMSVFDGSGDKGKIWLSQFEIGNYEYMIVSNVQYDESYNDDAYVGEDGSHADKLYYPMFKGSYDGTRLRSIAGQTTMCNTNASTEIARAKANGRGWNIGSWSKRNLLNCLLKIMSKSDDTQTAYGRGQDSGYVIDASQNYGKLLTGTLKDKGQFYGYNDGTHDVKVFYIETWWGMQWDRIVGLINLNGHILAKMTPPYNLTGDGYEDTGCTPAGTTGGYISESKSCRLGRIPRTAFGSSSTYQCDGLWFNNGIVTITLVGGGCNHGLLVGADCLGLSNAASDMGWNVGASAFLEQPITA